MTAATRDSSPDAGPAALLSRAPAALATLVLGLAVALRLPALLGVTGTASREAASAAELIAVFLLIVPLPLAGLGARLLPRRLGAPGPALPALHRLAFAFWGAALALFVVGLATRDASSFHPRWLLLEGFDADAAATWFSWILAGIFLVGASATLDALGVLVTAHTRRRKGLSLRGAPVLAWALYGRALAAALAAPLLCVLALTTLAERAFGIGLFDAALGGDPLVHRHLFWLALNPLLVTAMLPALGLVFEVLAGDTTAPATRRQRWSFVAFALLSPLGWGQHLIASGVSAYSAMVFSAWALLGLLPLFQLLIDAARRVAGLSAASPGVAAGALGLLFASLAFLAVGLRAGSLAVAAGLDVVLFGQLGLGLLVGLSGGALALGWVVERRAAPASALEPATAPAA